MTDTDTDTDTPAPETLARFLRSRLREANHEGASFRLLLVADAFALIEAARADLLEDSTEDTAHGWERCSTDHEEEAALLDALAMLRRLRGLLWEGLQS